MKDNMLAELGASQGRIYLTNIRSSQQGKVNEIIKDVKLKMRGLPFQIRLSPPRYCKRNSMAIITVKNNKIFEVKFTKIACKSWTCPECAPIKAIMARYLIRSTAVINGLDYFLTLTLDPKKIPLEYKSEKLNNTHKYITKLFNVLVTELRRRVNTQKEKLKYIWVIEFQKNGNAHLHILLNMRIDVKYIRSIWVRIGGGKIMKAESARSIKGLSFYLSNYIVKGLKKDTTQKSYFKYFEKRYAISQSCIRVTKNENLLFKNLSKDDKKKTINLLGLEWVYKTLENGDFEDKSI